jgi:hypothetical protein
VKWSEGAKGVKWGKGGGGEAKERGGDDGKGGGGEGLNPYIKSGEPYIILSFQICSAGRNY